jgi:tetratricopeptide (TPR) repeat protein
MMKNRLLMTLTLLAGLALALAAPAPCAAQAAEEKKPSWKSHEEYQAFQAMATEGDAKKKVALADAFLQKFTDSDFRDLAHLQKMSAFAQLGDTPNAIQAARAALELSPNNPDALFYVSWTFPFIFKADDPQAESQLARAETEAKRGLEALQQQQKPAEVSDEQFAQYVKPRRAAFNGTLGFVALQRKDYPRAITYLRASAEDNPTDVFTFYRLGLSHLYASPPDYSHAVWNMARSVALARASNNPAGAEIDKFLRGVYVCKLGSDEDLKQVISQAAASPRPPEGFRAEPVPVPEKTGIDYIDFFNEVSVQLGLGGECAQKIWKDLKGQPFGAGGFVEATEKTEGGFLVKIDLMEGTREEDGVYQIELITAQAKARNLTKGDGVRFTGTIGQYETKPNVILRLSPAEINAEDLPDAPRTQAKPAAPRRTTPRR